MTSLNISEQKLTVDGVQFTPWIEVPMAFLEWWAGSQSKPSKGDVLLNFSDNYGTYLFAEFPADQGCHDRGVKITEDPIIYVGKTGLQTFYERWTNTHSACKKLGKNYGDNKGLMRFFSR